MPDKQLDMWSSYPFYRGAPPSVDTDTSREAAVAIAPHVTKLARLVRDYIGDSYFGLTCYEIEMALSMKHQTASARVRELAMAGMIRDSGQRRLTSSGRRAIVWVIEANL